jgi:hypothetical protein
MLLPMSRLGASWAAACAASLAVLSVFAMLLCAAPAQAARPFTRALTDDVWFDTGPQWVTNTTATGAGVVLLELDWASVAKSAPTDPTSPSDPQYSFSYIDPVISKLSAAGLSVALLITDAPRWAEAAGGPAQFEADGAWEPNATELGQFAEAVARRYSGTFDGLPRVRYYQAWAEANFDIHLAPQWTQSGHGWEQTGPALYRNMLNAFYSGVKAANPTDTVITTGFGPYGDSPGSCNVNEVGPGCRMPPALFAQTLLCLQGKKLKTTSCPNPAHFDAMAADPYEVGSPTTKAAVADDISAPDLGKLSKPLKKAVSKGRALPRGKKPLWVTEFSYDSNPPNPGGVSLATQAKWLEQSFFIFWKEGVTTAVWYLLRDQTATFAQANYYSGLYFYNGAPKPALQAYQFPFVVMPDAKKVLAWGISPASGSLTVQHQKGKSWKKVFTLHASAGGVFSHKVSSHLHGNFEATVNGQTSLVWHR